MENKLYFIIPLIAILLILSNALFGHLIFGSPYGQDINKYSIYIHLQPEWSSYPVNIICDITYVWSNPNAESNVKAFDYDLSNTAIFTDYNFN